MIHIGQLIKEELSQQGRSASWFAKQHCCDRSNSYAIFKRQSIDSNMLLRISRILGHNFFDEYSKEYQSPSGSNEVIY